MRNTSQIHTPSPAVLRARLRDVAEAGALLHEAALRGEPMGPRELAQAVELNQQYVDILEAMESAPVDVSVTVEVDEQRVKFPNVEGLADWLSEIME